MPHLRAKIALRQSLRALRAKAHAAHPDAPFALRDRFLAAFVPPPASCVALYVARDHEIDPAPLAVALAARGHRLALPVVTGKVQPLRFRAYALGDALESGPYGIPLPRAGAAEVEPDIVLIPLLGFDKQGGRLGYGGGFYDRTLAALRARRAVLALGLAYAVQEVPLIPVAPHDEKLDGIATDADFFWASKNPSADIITS